MLKRTTLLGQPTPLGRHRHPSSTVVEMGVDVLDRLPLAHVPGGNHRPGHAEQKLNEVHIVDMQVDRRSPGPFEILGAPPGRPGDDPPETGGQDRPLFASVDQRFDQAEFRKITQHVGHHELAFPLFRRGDDPICLLQVQGDRFFQQHVLASFQGLQAGLGVQMSGQADVHQIHLGIGQQFVHRLIADHFGHILHSAAAAEIPLDAAPVPAALLRIARGHGVHLTSFDLFDRLEMGDAHETDADNTDIDHENLLVQDGCLTVRSSLSRMISPAGMIEPVFPQCQASELFRKVTFPTPFTQRSRILPGTSP